MTQHSISRRAVLGGTAASLVMASQRAAQAADTVVGFVYVGPRDDFGWNQAHAVAAAALKRTPGIKVIEEEYDGELGKLKAMKEAGNVTWDVMDVDSAHALAGCDEGLLEKLDYSKIDAKDKFLPGTALDCAVGTIAYVRGENIGMARTQTDAFQIVQILRECAKRTHWHVSTGRVDRSHVHF